MHYFFVFDFFMRLGRTNCQRACCAHDLRQRSRYVQEGRFVALKRLKKSSKTDIEDKATELKYKPQTRALAASMGDNSLGGVPAYTHDLLKPNGVTSGNLYFEWNEGIKVRDVAARLEMLRTWGVFTHYALEGFNLIETFEGIGYRGLPDRTLITAEYAKGRPIQWGSFTSIATGPNALATAQSFSNPSTSIILKIDIVSGKKLGHVSFFPTEGEVVLSPMSRLTVSSKPYEEDGWWFIDLIQQIGESFYFEIQLHSFVSPTGPPLGLFTVFLARNCVGQFLA